MFLDYICLYQTAFIDVKLYLIPFAQNTELGKGEIQNYTLERDLVLVLTTLPDTVKTVGNGAG